MKKLAVLALGVLVAACSETPTETPMMDVPEAALNIVLPQGNGIQMYSDDRQDCLLEAELCIGVGPIAVPLGDFEGLELFIETGNWATLSFTIGDIASAFEPTAEQVIGAAESFITAGGITLSLGGTEIPVLGNFRPELVQTVYDDASGLYFSLVGWRYFVKPQRKGSYTYQLTLFGQTTERLLTYVPDDLGEDEG